MPCYVTFEKPPSKNQYNKWVKLGWLGTYEDYLNTKNHLDIGKPMFWKGELGDHCTDCAGFGDFLCDYPVGKGLTCDRIVCEEHSKEIAPEIHYCTGHYKQWKEFKDSGGVSKSLKNIIAFSSEK